MRELGVYLHFPWCRKLCPYCDFAVEVGSPPHDDYLAAVLRELAARAPSYAGLGDLVSIYLGGGTPSLWRVDCVARAISAIRGAFDHHSASGGLEVTIEANPSDCTDDQLASWRTAGVNRVSIGVQSFHADELVVLGRDHRFGDGLEAIQRAARAGMLVSADFILGTPIASAATPGRTLEPPRVPAVADLAIDHLSIYELTIEDRTAFGARVRAGRLVPHDDDALHELYVATHAMLVARGWEHYEVSSYARPGRRAIHNSLYWRGAPYLGLGVGAASLCVSADGSGERVTNPRRARDYLAAPGQPAERLVIGAHEMAVDRAWLAMRTSDGIDATALPPTLAHALVEEGLAERRSGRICPTLRGFALADRIAARIVAAL